MQAEKNIVKPQKGEIPPCLQTSVQQGNQKEVRGTEKIFKEIITENFPNFFRNNNPCFWKELNKL